MSDTATETASDTTNAATPTAAVTRWLAALDSALTQRDANTAAALFNEESYWRDMVSFTWNIATAEGQAQVQHMIQQAVIPKKPSAWAIDGDASEAGGVTEAWVTFETAVGRGYGHLRLQGGKCWTLLTTLKELKGFEEAKGSTRPKGVVHGASQTRQSWLEQRQQEEAELGYAPQRTFAEGFAATLAWYLDNESWWRPLRK